MRKFLFFVPTALLLASFVPGIALADGPPGEPDPGCIEQCDKNFPGDSPEQVAIRGWCYILNGCWD